MGKTFSFGRPSTTTTLADENINAPQVLVTREIQGEQVIELVPQKDFSRTTTDNVVEYEEIQNDIEDGAERN